MTNQLCISADSHVVEAPEVFAGLRERFGDDAPYVEHVDGEGDFLRVKSRGRIGTNIGRLGVAGMYVHDPATQEQMRRGYAGMRPGVLDPIERLKDQEIDGIDAEVLYPSLLFGVYELTSPEIVAATFRNYNDWLANYCSQAPTRLYPIAAIPLHDIDAGVAELERAVKMGHRGAAIPCVPPAERPYSDRAYDRFWAAAQGFNVPLNMHIFTTAQKNHGLPDWGRIMNYALAHTGMAAVIGDIICGGVCARFPGLRFVPTEWETGWISHFLQRLDWAYLREPATADPDMKEMPTHYFHQAFTMTFEDDRVGVMTRDDIGVRNLMWGSDYPHHDSIFPRSQEILDDIFEGVSDEDRFAITAGNCRALYHLPLE